MMSENNDNDLLAKELEALKISYLGTLGERLDELEGHVLKLCKTDGDEGRVILREIIRELHSIKGSSGSYGVHFISKVCHNSEDYLQELDSSLPLAEEHETILLKFIDLMRFYVEKVVTYSTLDENQLENNLKEIYGNKASKIKVIVVDPTRSFFNAYQMALSDLNCQFYYTANGFSAFERIINIDYDYAIIAKSLDILDSSELIGCINSAKKKVGGIKTILISSNDYKSDQKLMEPDFFILKNRELSQNLLNVIKGDSLGDT